MNKYDIINSLARSHKLNRYLEICTPGTDFQPGFIDPTMLEVRHRLMYRCPETYDDGFKINFRTATSGSQDLVRVINTLSPQQHGYDIIFVDSFHTYDATIIDLQGALCLLRPGGILVVHGCNPMSPDIVGTEYHGGAWCGLTYQAFMNFVLMARPAGYCVVDCDHGYGVVFSQGCTLLPGLSLSRPDQTMIFEWTIASRIPDACYGFFARNRQPLLNLVAPPVFAEAYKAAVSGPSLGSRSNMLDHNRLAVARLTDSAGHALPSPAKSDGHQTEPAPRLLENDPVNVQLESRFTRVYETNMWKDLESVSGPGSRLDSSPVRETFDMLNRICNEFGIRSINDIPCGDLNFVSLFLQEFPSIAYTGFDIVQPLVQRNNITHPNIKCHMLDITSQVPPPSDLVLCKDLIIHLNDEDIRRTLTNIKLSGSIYLLASNNFNMPNNNLLENIHGDSACRYVDILAPPFNYSPPIWRSDYLGLWRLADL